MKFMTIERVGCFLVAMFILAAGDTHALGDRPNKKTELVGNAKECSDRAWKKIKTTGRTYNVDRRGYDEKTNKTNIWIGDYLFLVPPDHVNLVGSGYPADAPGISALLVAAIPEMTPHPTRQFNLVDGVSPMTMIFITCNYHLNANLTIKHAVAATRESELKTRLRSHQKVIERPLPELGLIGYQDERGFDTLYFPMKPTVKNPHGGALAIRCDERFPLKTNTSSDPKCSIRFVYRDGVEVEFRFPEHYLMHWRVSYERLLAMLNSFLVEQ